MQNKLSLLICFRKKCPLLVRHLLFKEMQSIEVKQRIYPIFFSYNVYFLFQNIGNSQNIFEFSLNGELGHLTNLVN